MEQNYDNEENGTRDTEEGEVVEHVVIHVDYGAIALPQVAGVGEHAQLAEMPAALASSATVEVPAAPASSATTESVVQTMSSQLSGLSSVVENLTIVVQGLKQDINRLQIPLATRSQPTTSTSQISTSLPVVPMELSTHNPTPSTSSFQASESATINLPPRSSERAITKLPVTGDLPNFSGGAPEVGDNISAEVFLNAMDNETWRSSWSDDQCIILAGKHLTGVAKETWSGHYRGIKDWRTFKHKFKSVFGLNRVERERYLFQYAPQRKAGEPLKAYLEKMYHTLNNFYPSGVMPEEDKLSQMRRILTNLLPSELLTPLFDDIPFSDMVKRIELHAQLYAWANLSSEKIDAENTTKTPTSLMKQIVAATPIIKGNKQAAKQTVGKTNSDSLSQPKISDMSVNTCQLCNQVGHSVLQCKRYKMLLKDRKDQRTHHNKNPQGRSSHLQHRARSFSNTTGRDQRVPWCYFCNRKGHQINNCWAKNAPAPAAPQYQATAAIGSPPVSPVSSSSGKVEQFLQTPGPSQQTFQHQVLQNPQAIMQSAALPWRTTGVGSTQSQSPVTTGANRESLHPMITYPPSPANPQ